MICLRRTTALPLVSISAAMLLAACGGSPTATDTADGSGKNGSAQSRIVKDAKQVYDRFNAMSGEKREQALIKAAEKEGELSIYTSNSDMADLVSVFEDQYDIDVSVYRATDETVVRRLLEEQKAGFYGNDFLETDASGLVVAAEEDLLATYKSELRDKVPNERQGKRWTATRYNVFTIAWNTKRLTSAEVPKSLDQLASPQWKGKVSMEPGDYDWFATMYNYYKSQGKSDAEVKKLFSQIASNSKVVKGHTTQTQLLSTGQFSVAVSDYNHLIEQAKAEGAPVSWQPPIEPVVVRPNGAALMKTAKHPAAAMLFMRFELTRGQKFFAKVHRVGSIPAGEDPLAGLETVIVPSKVYTQQKKWNNLYADIVRKGQEVD